MISKQTQIVALIAFIYASIASGLLWWVSNQISVSGEALSTRVAAIAEQNARSRAYSELTRMVKNSEQKRTALAQHLLTEDQTSSFLTDIESLGMAQGVELTTDSLKVTRQESFTDLLTIDFSISGQEPAVMRMLELFENLPYHSQVTSLTFTRGSSGKVESSIELTVSLFKHVQ
jgi:hypothetical protein